MKTNKIKIEIRAAAGGEDSKLLTEEMAFIYQKAAVVNSFTCSIEH